MHRTYLTFAAAALLAALAASVPASADTMMVSANAPAQLSSAPAATSQAKPAAAHAQVVDENSKTEVVWEWDPYYSDVDFNIPLTNKPIPTITSDSEPVIYRELIEGSLVPRYMLLEASVYPMPVLGTYIKSHSPSLYDEGQISHTGLNVIESATAGFQEPWALSAFFGNIANLQRPGDTRPGTNLGYTGWLISGGAQHIKDNTLIQDDWYEVEWKIKGKLDYADENLTWSFRVGGKFNANPGITDVVYVGIRRSNLDFHQPFLGWFKNSDVDLQLQFAQGSGAVVREELVFGKKYPFPERGYSLTLDLGFIWDSPKEYSGVLRDKQTSSLTFVFRPGLEF